MYDNISVEQSDKGLGRILKTSHDLSAVAVIANARCKSLMSHSIENGPGDICDGREHGSEIDRKSQFQGIKI